MLLSEFEQYVLGWVSDDYESLQSIQANIRADFPGLGSEMKILDSLLKLERHGLVRAYLYNRTSESYVIVEQPSKIADPLSLWFLATDSGREHGEKTWS